MKLHQIVLSGIVASTIGYVLVKLIWGEPIVLPDLLARHWFLVLGILGGWYFKEKEVIKNGI